MQSLLKSRADFTAVVVGNDQMALGAMAALSERGLRIPEDVSVVGFDDIPGIGVLSTLIDHRSSGFFRAGRTVCRVSRLAHQTTAYTRASTRTLSRVCYSQKHWRGQVVLSRQRSTFRCAVCRSDGK
ncbi:MAG: substrate-binding domain-containing protein [Chloroflexi bacterium]|nr:substrate-binding domain-containing protein [Chloroflexota bacterium]